MTVVASEAITVTGTPRIPVLGLTSKYFNYASGTGTTSLVFTYTVVTGDSATAGIGVTLNTLALNSGTMQDTGDLPLVLTHAGIAQSSSHQVDGILPAFSGVTQTFSVPENETRTINLTTTEPATLTKSGGGDSAYFILNTAVSPATLTITARDFENKLDADSNNVYYVGITLRDAANNNTGSYNFFVTITDVAEYANVSAPTLSAQPVKGIVVTITVTSDVAGKVDFYANRKRIAGCLARLTSGSSAPFTATCTWKTTSVAPATLYATMNPTNSAYAVTTSPSVIVASSARKTTR